MWLEDRKPSDILVVFYEDLKDQLIANMHDIVKFLSYDVDEARMKCIAAHHTGHVQRPANSAPSYKNLFTEEQKDFILQHVQALDEVMKSAGLKSLPKSYYDLSKFWFWDFLSNLFSNFFYESLNIYEKFNIFILISKKYSSYLIKNSKNY